MSNETIPLNLFKANLELQLRHFQQTRLPVHPYVQAGIIDALVFHAAEHMYTAFFQ